MWNKKKQKITYHENLHIKENVCKLQRVKFFTADIFKPFLMIIVTGNVSLVEIGFLVLPIRSCYSLYQS